MQCVWRPPAGDKNTLSDWCHAAVHPLLVFRLFLLLSPFFPFWLKSIQAVTPLFTPSCIHSRTLPYKNLPTHSYLWYILGKCVRCGALWFWCWSSIDEKKTRGLPKRWSGKLLVQVPQIKCLSVSSCTVCAKLISFFFSYFLWDILIFCDTLRHPLWHVSLQHSLFSAFIYFSFCPCSVFYWCLL